jgi:hypothetical protein
MLCANAFATPIYHPSGPNLTYGAVSNNQSIISNVTNPAAGAAVFTKEDSQYRFGILSSIGFGYEFGQVDDLYKEIDAAKAAVTDSHAVNFTSVCPSFPTTTPTDADVTNCANSIAASLNSTVFASVNTVLNTLQSDGYVSGFISGHVPLMPLVISHKGLGGSFVFDANYTAIGNMTFLADPVALVGGDVTAALLAYIAGGKTGNLGITLPNSSTDSTLLVRAAAIAELGLGYSRPVMKGESGELMAGFRAKYYSVGLERAAKRLFESNGAENTFDASKDYVKSSGFGLDIGALWISTNYRVGAWVDNVNKPSFKFNAVDVTGYTDATVIALLSESASYKMDTQLHLEGALYTESQNWVINVGLDGNAIKDPVGSEYQWATLSAGYATDSWWIPGFRVGYRTNMAGTQLSYMSGGLTLFKSVTLDVAYGLDSVVVDGEKAPRSAMLNLGIELSF